MIEQERFAPFTAVELCNPINDAKVRHLIWLTREVLASAREQQIIDEFGRVGAGYDRFFFYGQNLVIKAYRAWVGYWPLAWSHFPKEGPLWIQIYGLGTCQLLKEESRFNIPDNGAAYPIFSPESATSLSQEDEVQTILKSFRTIVERLPGKEANSGSI